MPGVFARFLVVFYRFYSFLDIFRHFITKMEKNAGVESGMVTVHIPLRDWTVDFRCKPFFFGFGRSGCQSNEFPSSRHVPQRVPNSSSLVFHMLWQRLFSFHLYRSVKIEPSIFEILHSFIFFELWANQIGSLQNKKEKNLEGTSSNE